MIYKKVDNCRICFAYTEPIYEFGEMALTGVFPKPGEDVPTGPLTLCRCGACGLVQLGENYNPELLYGETYGYRSGLNPSMVEHLQETVDYIRSRGFFVFENSEDTWLDIGSNDGTLLSLLPQAAIYRVGMDPLAEKFAQHYPRGAQFIPEPFSKEVFNDKAMVVTSIAMFYDLEDPVEFARDVYDILDDDGVWYTEQAYFPAMIYNNAYDSICQEHLSYYRLQDIVNIATIAGFVVLDVRFNNVNGGSFGVLLGKKGNQWGMLVDNLEVESGIRTDAFLEFIDEHPKQVQTLLGELEDRNIFGLGASTKGNVVLQHCKVTSEQIKLILDVNEEKDCRVTPGTNIPIYHEDKHTVQIRNLPEYLLVLPWHFREFFLKKRTAGKGGPKFIFLLPELEIV